MKSFLYIALKTKIIDYAINLLFNSIEKNFTTIHDYFSKNVKVGSRFKTIEVTFFDVINDEDTVIDDSFELYYNSCVIENIKYYDDYIKLTFKYKILDFLYDTVINENYVTDTICVHKINKIDREEWLSVTAYPKTFES